MRSLTAPKYLDRPTFVEYYSYNHSKVESIYEYRVEVVASGLNQ